MPFPLGPIAAKVGIAAGKKFAEGFDSKRQRADARSAAELEIARSREVTMQNLALALGRATDPVQIQAIQAQLDQLRNAEVQKVQATERGKTTRRVTAAAAVIGTVIAGGWFINKNIKDFRDAVIPDVSVTTEQKLGAALNKVEQRSDKIIATGSGVGEATVTTRANVGMFGVDVRVPGGLVGSEAKVTIPRNLDVVSRAGAVTLKPFKDPADGSWDVLALVNPAKITTQVSGNQPPTSDSGATSGFFNELGRAVGINDTEQTKLYQSAQTLAVTSFEASASRTMTQTRTIAALEANSIRQSIQEVQGATPAGPANDALARLATAEIRIAFVNVDEDDNQMTLIDPGEPTAVQAHMSLPKYPGSAQVRLNVLEVNMTTPAPEQILMSQETRNNLAAIENQPGYTLETDQSVLTS